MPPGSRDGRNVPITACWMSRDLKNIEELNLDLLARPARSGNTHHKQFNQRRDRSDFSAQISLETLGHFPVFLDPVKLEKGYHAGVDNTIFISVNWLFPPCESGAAVRVGDNFTAET